MKNFILLHSILSSSRNKIYFKLNVYIIVAILQTSVYKNDTKSLLQVFPRMSLH
jgi:hypothetical protein